MSTETQTYTTVLAQELGREPTQADLEAINEELHRRLAQKEMQEQEGLDLEARFEVLEDMGLEEVEIDSVVRNYALAQRQEQQAKERKKIQRKARWSRFRSRLAGFVVLGATIGAGIGAYLGIKQPAADTAQKHYEKRLAELEDQFFGPLDDLTTITCDPGVTQTEAELYIDNGIGNGNGIGNNSPYYPSIGQILEDNKRTVYDGVHGDVRIMGKKVYDRLFIFKIHNDTIASAFVYGDDSDIEDLVEDGEPLRSTLICNGEVKHINHDDETVVVVNKNRVQYQSSETGPYDHLSEQALKQFERLYVRGPGSVSQ